MRRVIACSIRVVLFSSLAALVVVVAPPRSSAQSPWLPRDKDTAVMLEMLRPNVESLDADAFSAAFLLGGRHRVSDGVAIVGEIPYVRHEDSDPTYSDYFFGYRNGETIGNPYIGLEVGSATSPFIFELGGRFPTASSSEQFPLYTGRSVDQTRVEAFLSDAASVQAAINLREASSRGIVGRVRICPSIQFVGNTSGDIESMVHYSFDIGYVGRWIRIGSGMSGSTLLNDYFTADRNLGARTTSQVDLHGDFLTGPIRPGLGVRVPIGSAATYFPVIFGVTVAWVR